MSLLYFKQAWNLIRQEKLFSSLYIIGTGLSITVVMALSIVYYIRIADIYPETNRSRMLVVNGAVEELPNRNISSSNLSFSALETCFLSLANTEAVAAIWGSWGKEHFIQLPGSKEQMPVTVKYVDTAFWNVFSFRFRAGAPFTAGDFRSGIRSAVLSESFSKRLFGTAAEAIGQYVSLNFMPYRVCGVVKDVSFVTETTFAQLWIPYTVIPDYKHSFSSGGTLGRFAVHILASPTGDLEKIRNEALDNVRKLNGTLAGEAEFKLMGQPDRHWESTFRSYTDRAPDFTKLLLQYGLVFLILLLIPGISLSGMTDSRMERRLSETGIRRAFGAPVKTLTGQIFTENFLFTLLGGIVGLCLSYVLILASSDWIMHIGLNSGNIPPDGTRVIFTAGMLINIPVFLIALGVCFLLNLIAAFIPAWRASHRDIIFSLNAKQ